MKKARRKSNLDQGKIQAQKDKGVTMLRRFGDSDAADKLEAESLGSYALRKGIRVDNPRSTAKKKPARKKNMWPFSRRAEKTVVHAKGRSALVRAAISHGKTFISKAVHNAVKGKQFSEIKVDVSARANPKCRKRNAFGLDRFFGRKSRVTSSDWNRAGEARRAQALRAAGVTKKLLPAYTDMSWRDLQGLEPSFITKVMASLPARKNTRRAKTRVNLGRVDHRRRPGDRRSKVVRTRKNTSGTALAKKIRELMRDNGLSRSEATKAATRILRASHTKPGEYKRSRRHERRNPDALDRAGATYAMFHGRGPKEVVKVNELTGGPKTVTALGDLLYFVVVPGDDDSAAYKVKWGDGDKRPFLASNAKATQLYIVGGNQDVDEMLRKMGVTSSAQDLLDLGEVREVEYYTQKDFDNFTPIQYFHHFGEEDAKRNPRGRIRRPRLIYSRSNKKLMLAGGAYKIKKDGIIN